MTPGEIPERSNYGYEADARFTVCELCSRAVGRHLAEVTQSVASGTFEHTGYDVTSVGFAIEDMATEALNRDDRDTAEAWMDIILDLPGANNATVANICYVNAAVGSQRAFDILANRLEAERFDVLHEMDAIRQARPHILRPYVPSVALEAVIARCEANDMPPDSWIDKYAASPEHCWRLYATHYARLAKPDSAEAGTNQAKLEGKVTELVTDPLVDEAFIFNESSYLLRIVDDPELRAKVIERYKDASASIMLTPSTFKHHIFTAGTVLHDEALGNQANIEFFEATINMAAETLREAGYEEYELAKSQLAWGLSLQQYYGATPREQVEYIDLQTSRMLASDIPESPEGSVDITRNKKFVVLLRDSMLSSFAESSARSGDFTNARLFLDNISGEIAREYAAQDCLAHAKTQTEVNAIKPDEMTLLVNEGLNMRFRIAEALLTDEPNELSGLALKVAEAASSESLYITYEDIKRLYGAAAKHGAGVDLARGLLDVLRAKEAQRFITETYSDALIVAGDPDEPQRAYEEIQNRSLNMSLQLGSLMRLRHLLEVVS